MRLSELVRCPGCRGALHEGEGERDLRCKDCQRRYPIIGGIPVLVPEPERLIAEWRALSAAFDRAMGVGLDELLAQTTTYDLESLTKTRLETLHEHLGRHRERIVALAKEAGLFASAPAVGGAENSTFEQSSLVENYAQLHRDWGWDGDEPPDRRELGEADEATATVSALVGERPLGKLLVLGAGACRLTRDLHHRHGATTTLALDVDPLPFVVAKKILEGNVVELYEFPPWPLDSTKLFADRKLASRQKPDPSLHLVFADGLDPPVRAESFDTVLTPWFIDEVPTDMRKFFFRVRELLPVGGRWLNFGPLVFRQERTALPHRYCVDEVLDLVGAAGFRVERHSFRPMTYLRSPIGSQGRTETVLAFSAEKLALAPAQRVTADPDWLSTPSAAVPLVPGLSEYRAEHPMFEAIVRLVDGARSTSDIADVLIREHSLPRDAALPAVQACLRAIVRKLAGERGS